MDIALSPVQIFEEQHSCHTQHTPGALLSLSSLEQGKASTAEIHPVFSEVPGRAAPPQCIALKILIWTENALVDEFGL